jgi:hypothetical protein
MQVANVSLAMQWHSMTIECQTWAFEAAQRILLLKLVID